MTIEENKKLIERYPFLKPKNDWTGEDIEDYDYSWIEGVDVLPEGWEKLFLQMCEDIRQPLIDANFLNKFRFSEIKEKYNTMRAYNFGAPTEVQEIIDKYEYISQFVCQKCGAPAMYEIRGWITSYCKDCFEDICKRNNFYNKENATKIKFNPIMCIYYGGKYNYKKYISCEDIWERLYGKN